MAANNNLKDEENKIDVQSQIEKPKTGAGFQSFKYKKLIAAGAVAILAIIGVAAAATNNSGTPDNKPGQGTTLSDNSDASILDDDFEVDAHPEVNALVQEYFKAYAAGDADAIEKVAYPITKTEKSYIQMYSKYVDKYEDIKCYTKRGLSEGEYLLSVECSTKFKDIKTSVPGLEFFYVRTDKDGNVYIDNAYGQFNESYKENKTDVEITRLKTAYDQDEDLLELLKEAQENYEKALDSDEELKVMMTDTIQNAIKEWVKNVGIMADEEKDDEKEDNQNTETSERTAYTTTKVNLREKRSISSEVIKTLKKDSKITVSGQSKNGWLKAEYKGNTGYIKEDYITFKAPKSNTDKEEDIKTKDQTKDNSSKDNSSKDNKTKDSETKDDKSKEEEKRTGYAKTKVNLRKSRSTSSKILKTLKAGTAITVYGDAENKWYKVEYKGKTGYIHKNYVVFDKSKVKKEKSSGRKSDSSTPSYFPEGKSITLTQTVNVRTSMSENADLVGLAYQGDVVTVVMSYAEGWTKVSWNDQTGFVKTDVLK